MARRFFGGFQRLFHMPKARASLGILGTSMALDYASAPEKDSYAEQQSTETLLHDPEGYFKRRAGNLSVNFMSRLAELDLYHEYITKMIESYVHSTYGTLFDDNLTEDGKQRVFFRGETLQEAKKAVDQGRGIIVFSIGSKEFSLPWVNDHELPFGELEKPAGYTSAMISTTTDLPFTENFGLGEAVLVTVPDRVANTAQHTAMGTEPSEIEYACTGISSQQILGIARRNETGDFISFELNPRYKGFSKESKDLELELDGQMQPLIDLIPDFDPRKKQLQSCVKVDADYREFYKADIDRTRKALASSRLSAGTAKELLAKTRSEGDYVKKLKFFDWRSFLRAPAASEKLLKEAAPIGTLSPEVTAALQTACDEYYSKPYKDALDNPELALGECIIYKDKEGQISISDYYEYKKLVETKATLSPKEQNQLKQIEETGIFRPQHGLTHAVRQVMQVENVVAYHAKHGFGGEIETTAEIKNLAKDKNFLQQLQVALAFFVTGRDSEVGFRSSVGGIAPEIIQERFLKYRAQSGEALKKFVLENNLVGRGKIFVKEDLDDLVYCMDYKLYDESAPEGHPLRKDPEKWEAILTRDQNPKIRAIKHILHATHCLDLQRMHELAPREIFTGLDTKAAIPEEVQGLIARAKRMADAIKVYDVQDESYKLSRSVKECYDKLVTLTEERAHKPKP